jgi:sugar lactone lactonase YvrE
MVRVMASIALAALWAATAASAQVPQCEDTSVTVQEDSLLQIMVACTDGGYLRDLAVDHIASVVGSGFVGWAGDGGPATAATMNLPSGVAVDRAGNIYVAESGNHIIRRVDAVTGVITTIAGLGSPGYFGDGGLATLAPLNDPRRVIVDAQGNVFVSDIGNARVRRIDAATGVITTVAGGGTAGAAEGVTGTAADFIAITGIAFDSLGDLFVVEVGRGRIRRISGGVDGLITGEADELIFTIAGTGIPGFSGDGGPALNAQFSLEDIAFDRPGNLYIADRLNNRVRRITPGVDGFIRGAADEIVTTVAGGGALDADGILATDAMLSLTRGVTVDRFGNIFISDSGTVRVRRVDAATGLISTVAGGGTALGEGIPAATARVFNPRGLATDAEGNLFISELGAHRIRAVRLVPVTWTYEIVQPPSHGLASMSGAGALSYTPNANFSGNDVITFRALNAAGHPGDSATVSITVTPVNDLPIANAGPDQTVSGAVAVRLDGSASNDPDGTPITFSWAFISLPSGSGAVLQDQNTANPLFTPDVSGAYVAELTVTDSSGYTARDSVTVTATILIGPSRVELSLWYRDAGWSMSRPPSATGANYWLEGELVSRTETVRKCEDADQTRCAEQALTIELGRINDSVTRTGVLDGEYEVRLRHLPDGPVVSPLTFSPGGVVRVQAGQTTSVRAELEGALGQIQGNVTLNGNAPGPGLKLCVVGLDRTRVEDPRLYTWCMDLESTRGSFNLLLPAGEGRGSVCPANIVTEHGQCEALDPRRFPVPNAAPPLARFDFNVAPGVTTVVPPIEVRTSKVD